MGPCDAGPVNPALKKVLFGALAAVCGALATYFATGCNPAQVDAARSAADRGEAAAEIAFSQAKCAKAVALSVDPNAVNVRDAAALADRLKACFAKPAGDAGVN